MDYSNILGRDESVVTEGRVTWKLLLPYIIEGRSRGDIADQFFAFVREYEHALAKYGRTPEAMQALYHACMEKNILRSIMSSRESEVYTMLMEIFSQERATLAYGMDMARAAHKEGIQVGRKDADKASAAMMLRLGRITSDEVRALFSSLSEDDAMDVVEGAARSRSDP